MALLRSAAALLLLASLAALPGDARAAATLSKGVTAYARDMEHYYQERREEVLPGMLRTFDAAGVLADPRRRITLAAFLGEALRTAPSVRQRLLPPPPGLSRDGRRALAWAAHLAQLPDEARVLGALLDADDRVLLEQIRRSPAPLAAWNISAGKKEAPMFWAGYTASGDTALLDALIGAVLRYARLKGAGLRNDPAYAAGEAAAALLYECAPQHPDVVRRLEAALGRAAGAEADVLRLILRR